MTLGIPLTWIVTGLADHAGLASNGLAMCLISPGEFLILNGMIPLHPKGFLDALGKAGMVMLITNFLYYSTFVWGLLACIQAFASLLSNRSK